MEAYTDFAQVYDELMDDTPYEEWCGFLMELFRRYGVDDVSKEEKNIGKEKNIINDKDVIKEDWEKDANHGERPAASVDDGTAASGQEDANLNQERNTVLDLGCGTGMLTELLARKGYEMIGLDNSQEMLQIAIEKRERSGLPILYLMQDMKELELYGTVGAVVSVCDSLNYLLTEEDVVETFRRVNNYLYPRGIFVFDFNTVYKYAEVIGDTTIAENREDCSFIWENYYHEAQEINEYDLTVFVAGDRAASKEQGMWFRRFREVHYQRGYRLEQMKTFLAKAGLDFVRALDADSHGEVTAESERVYVVARKGAGTKANQGVIG